MKDDLRPSKFQVKALASDDEIWSKALETLSPKDREEADKSMSTISEPYLGGKEISIKRKDNSVIAFASLSEIHKDNDEWAVYQEG